MRKSRLSQHLSDDARIELAEAMFAHVLSTVGQSPAIDNVAILAAERPRGWGGGWFADTGTGLNAELEAVARITDRRLLILHADLPALTPADIDALIAAAADANAIAPDRHLRGTNALALSTPAGVRLAFGQDSLARHCERLPGSRIVRRPGLELDVDVPDDLEEAIRRGALNAVR